MKTKMKIFNIIFGVLLCLAPVALRADDIECGYFNPAFGLCSTHSHNIAYIDGATNLPANPDKSEDVAQMNHIIALKSTVIAQQLKDQYDALSVIIKRFKTQLEKAVLVSKIEVLTGNTASENSNGSSSGSGTGSNKGLPNAEDCSSMDYDKIFDCLKGNLQKVRAAATSDTTNARYQLDKDVTIMDMYTMCGGKNKLPCSTGTVGTGDYKTYCKGGVKSINARDIPQCVDWLTSQVNAAKNIYNQENRSYYGR